MSKLAIITGGSRGIGRSAALALARRGFNVVITYRADAAAANAVVGELEKLGRRGQALQLDIAKPETFEAFAAQVPASIDILVHNGGTGSHGEIGALTPAAFDEQISIHFKGPLFLTQALLPKLARGGTIIQISSGLTRYTYPGGTLYAAAKGGFEVAIRYLARELGPRGITANTIAPGGVVTDFGGGYLRDAALQSQVVAATPLGRVAEPDDIGNAVDALVGMPWVTGQRIEATGGYEL